MDAGRAPGAGNPYTPPQAAIDAATVPAIEVGGVKSARGLANAIAIVLGALALVEVALGVSSTVTAGVMRRIAGGETAARSLLSGIAVRTTALSGLHTVLTLAAIVLFCLFMVRANRNARSFGAPLANSPGWSAGWFFVPVAFLWKPYLAMKEIWQGSDPDPSVPAFQASVSSLVRWWWAMFLLRMVGGGVTNQMRGQQPWDVITATWVQSIRYMPSIVAAILAGAVVRALARRQDERQRREHARAAPPLTAGAVP